MICQLFMYFQHSEIKPEKTDNLYTKEQASQCDLELVKRRKRKNKKKKKRPASVPNPCILEKPKNPSNNLQTVSIEDPLDAVVEARQK